MAKLSYEITCKTLGWEEFKQILFSYFQMRTIFQSLGLLLSFLLFSILTFGAPTHEVKIVHVYGFDKYEINSFDEVLALESKSWHEVVPKSINLGLKSHAVWLKVEIPKVQHTDDMILRIGNPTLYEVSIYDEAGRLPQLNEFVSISHNKAFENRNYSERDLLFNVPTGSVVYLKVLSDQPLMIPLTLGNLQKQHEISTVSNLIISMYLGILLIMFIYNLFIAIGIKSSNYYYYVFYVFFLGITHLYLSGFGFQFLWSSSLKSETIGFNIFAALSSVLALLFTQRYLKLKTYYFGVYQFFNILIAAQLFTIFLNFLDYNFLSFRIRQALTLISAISAWIVSIAVVRKAYLPAKFFTWAWSFMYLGVVVYIFSNYGWLPQNFITQHAVYIGVTLQLALLSFGLANRITSIKSDRDRLQILALKSAKMNERFIMEQNIHLEKRVEERTRALNESHNQLLDALKHLKQTQNHLIEQEKMSSLGILTAGIAHEINNPINFVVGNINPLERNLKDVLNLIDEIEFNAREEKHAIYEFIKTKKKDLEYELIVEESMMLLEGIREGAQRTAIIVKGLKTFSRMDGESWSYFNMNTSIESSLVILKNKLSNIKIHKKLGELPEVYSQPGKINQAFLNLISNSIDAIYEKYEEQKGGEIELETYLKNEHVFVIIKDNGIGMTEETKSKIFNPFYTTKAVGQGTGLGMSIAFTIIEEHGGSIKINSVENEASEIMLKFPLNFIETIGE